MCFVAFADRYKYVSIIFKGTPSFLTKKSNFELSIRSDRPKFGLHFEALRNL